MTVLSEKESSLRAYLLGQLNPEEQRRIEEQLLLDSDYVELLLSLEEELTDSYVSDELSEREREQFQKHFLTTPERRRKLRMAKALRRYINNPRPTPAQARVIKPKVSWWQQLLTPAWHSGISDSQLQPGFAGQLLTPAWRSAIAAMLVLGLGIGIWRVLIYESLVDKGRAALRVALRESPTEGRIANFNWPPRQVTLGESDNVADRTSLEIAERYLLEAARAQQSSDTHYALGQFYLAKGELKSAIEEFNKALESMPKNAKLHSDLGAAFLEMAKSEMTKGDQVENSGSRWEYLYKSLGHLDRALELDPSLLEALFNRALCHQYMLSPSRARADWLEYLSRDADSSWAEAARRHIKEIEDQNQKTSQGSKKEFEQFLSAYQTGDRQAAWKVVCQNRKASRLIWWQLLDDFFQKRAAGQPAEANASLEALRYVGKLELNLGEEDGQRKGDPYVSEIAEFYASTSLKQQAGLSEAHKQINEGYRLYDTDKNPEAIGSFIKARETFARIRNQREAMLADLLIAYCKTENGDHEDSGPIFERLAGECREKDYLWLLAQSFYGMGMVQDRLADHSKALESTNQALKISVEISDFYNTQRSLSQIADQYRKLGNYELASTYLNRCLKQASVFWPGSSQMWRIYDQLTQALNARQLNAAAAAYASEALRLALDAEEKSPATICGSYVLLALTRSKQQDYTEAINMANRALDAAPTDGLKGYASLQLGQLYRQAGDCNQALGYYDRSIEYIASSAGNDAGRAKSGGLPVLQYEAHKGRLLCLFAQGNDAPTQEELDRTIMLLEKSRENIREEQDRNTFFNVEQYVYDAAIDFQYSKRKDAQAVFEYSEKSRARSLLRLITSEPALHTLDLAETQRLLPAQTQLIEYVALDDKLLICLVSKTEFSVKEISVGLSELTDKVLDFRRAILSHTTEPSEQAQALYNLLIKPVELSREKGERICIVPDKILNYLPFDALVSPESGSYFIEDYQPMVAPSAAIYLAMSEHTNHTTDLGHERLLAVGDPNFDRAAFPQLDPLPSTRQQVREIAELYQPPMASVLTGPNAREETIKREMEESDVIHFASHYVVDEGNPMNSKLLVAQEPRDGRASDSSSGFMQAKEVYGLKLQHRAPLVILSACESGVEHYYNGEGMIGMSRVFIAAGAPVVVASLWKVNAHATDKLMINFHKHRKLERLSTPEALRLAQMDMLRDPSKKHPYYWAGFTAIGGHTDF